MATTKLASKSNVKPTVIDAEKSQEGLNSKNIFEKIGELIRAHKTVTAAFSNLYKFKNKLNFVSFFK